jgi:hypothetical protein
MVGKIVIKGPMWRQRKSWRPVGMCKINRAKSNCGKALWARIIQEGSIGFSSAPESFVGNSDYVKLKGDQT